MKGAVPDRLRRIEGRHNSLVKELRRAFSQGELTESGACAIEGVRILEEAIRSGLRLEAVFFSASAETRAERLLPQIAAHVETLLLPDKLFAGAVPSGSPQGVAAMVRVKQFTLQDIVRGVRSGVVVAVAGVQDPGNVGTIVRSAEAFGASGVVLGENTVSPYNSKVVRASAGSVFRLPVVRAELGDAISILREHQARLLATSSHRGTPLNEANFTPPAAVFIGNEGAGLTRDVLAQMDEVIAIPHAPQVESLNAGVAASIVLYEAARRKR
jgi:RNA methyltransferase, TrmH family